MTEKIGRNDPCPCGSGKKYKQCCMKKKQEPVAKYTASGKRKFKAKLLSTQDKSASVFGHAAPSTQEIPTKSATLEKLKFRKTQEDFQKEESQEPMVFEESQQAPQEQKKQIPNPNDTFKPTSEDFREKN